MKIPFTPRVSDKDKSPISKFMPNTEMGIVAAANMIKAQKQFKKVETISEGYRLGKLKTDLNW